MTSLGAISQALLTLEAANKNNLTVASVILNVVEKKITCLNKEALSAYTETPVVSFSQDDLRVFCSEIEKLV